MQIIIKKTNIELDADDQLLIQDKLSGLEKYFPDIQQIRFEIEKSNSQKKGDVYRAEVNFHIPNNLIRVEKLASSWRKAMEKVRDHAKRSLSEEKKKILDKKRRQK